MFIHKQKLEKHILTEDYFIFLYFLCFQDVENPKHDTFFKISKFKQLVLA